VSKQPLKDHPSLLFHHVLFVDWDFALDLANRFVIAHRASNGPTPPEILIENHLCAMQSAEGNVIIRPSDEI
jgi:hypothetical protein